MKGDYSVVKREKGWAVYRHGAKRAIKIHRTRGAALGHSFDLAEKTGSKINLHNSNGEVEFALFIPLRLKGKNHDRNSL